MVWIWCYVRKIQIFTKFPELIFGRIDIQYFRNAVSRKYKFHGSKNTYVLVVFFNTHTHVP